MDGFVMFATQDEHLIRILCVVDSKDTADGLLESYQKLSLKFYTEVESFEMKFNSGISYQDQLDVYINSDTWCKFKTDQYLNLKETINVTDKTLYGMLRGDECLDYQEIGNEPC